MRVTLRSSTVSGGSSPMGMGDANPVDGLAGSAEAEPDGAGVRPSGDGEPGEGAGPHEARTPTKFSKTARRIICRNPI